MWEEEYLKRAEPVRLFNLERDAIEDFTSDSESETEEDGFSTIPFAEASSKLATIRTQAYKQAWEACQADIRKVLQSLYNDTISQLQAFIRDAPLKPPFRQRALITGVILGSNATLTSALVNALQEAPRLPAEGEAGPSRLPQRTQRILVARISSRGCANKRSALKTMIQAVIASDKGDHEGDVTRRPAGKKLSMAAPDDMETLVAWYESRYRNSDAPRVALYFEELESFDSAVLADILYILSLYCHRLPLILLFAISTSIDAIHTLLPRATSELLRIAAFTVTPNIETFHSLIFETFIMRRQVLTPSTKVFAFLRDTFLDLNQSIDGVLAKLQYMYLAHFYGNPFSVLSCPLPEDLEIEDQLDLLGDIVPSLRSLPSFRKAVEDELENSSASTKNSATRLRMTRNLLENDEHFLRSVNAARRERDVYLANLPQAWTLFEVLQGSWKEGRLSTETLLTEYFSGTMLRRASIACRNLRNARDDIVLAFLKSANETFSAAATGQPCNLKEALGQLEVLLETGTKQAGLTRLVNGNIQGSIVRSDGDKDFTAFVKDLSDRLESYFKEHLKPFTELSFHEIWYPDVHRVMRSAFHPHILDQVQTSLVAPSSRLPLHLFQTEEEDQSDLQPKAEDLDVCKAYNLVAGAGKLVNLADWFGAFEIALEDADEKEKEEEAQENGSSSRAAKRRKPSVPAPSATRKDKARATEQPNGHSGTNGHIEAEDGHEGDATRKRRHEARFLSAAADLAYLGFVQPTKRKAEHVARVVF